MEGSADRERVYQKPTDRRSGKSFSLSRTGETACPTRTVYACFRPAPLFPICCAANERGLVSLTIGEAAVPEGWRRDDSHPLLRKAGAQIEAYFAGNLRDFDLPLDLRGTAFQKKVWNALLAIPYGETLSYADLAHEVGSVARAVGQANGANPVAIIVPCHRVIGADGTLCGYGGGLERKRYLLALEGGLIGDSVSALR